MSIGAVDVSKYQEGIDMIFNLDQYKIVSTCVCDSEYGEIWNLGSIYDAIETKSGSFIEKTLH